MINSAVFGVVSRDHGGADGVLTGVCRAVVSLTEVCDGCGANKMEQLHLRERLLQTRSEGFFAWQCALDMLRLQKLPTARHAVQRCRAAHKKVRACACAWGGGDLPVCACVRACAEANHPACIALCVLCACMFARAIL